MSEEQLIATPGVFGETGNFLLERELGRGGMGGVYMGRDKMLDRPVAVKVMLKQYGADAAFVEKFKREAQAAARLIHPNIAQIYSYGIADGMPYIAMELVAGGSLDQLMKNAPGATEIPRVMKIGEQVAQALRCAADQGLVHGDVKPENVLLDSNGNAKLVDFGLAAMQNDTNEIWGTPYYIAPEKVKKEPVDYRADMYSLGGTLYHALTGVAPFEGEDAPAVVRKRFEGAPKAPSQVRAGISPQIDALILKMLALNPADRFPSFEALLEEFKRVMASGLTTATSATPAARPTATGGKKLIMKGKGSRKFKVSHTETASTDGEGGDEDSGKSKRRPTQTSSSDDDEERGGVGGKVALTIGGTIAAIGLVIGGLVWFTVADKKAREAEHQAQVTRHINEAMNSIAGTRKNALAFADELAAMAKKAVQECQTPTDQLIKSLRDDFDSDVLPQIKPPPTKDLLDAYALTNVVEEAAADSNAVAKAEAPAPAAAAAAAASPAAAVAAPAAPAIPQFRPPTDDEADPMSPEHETYLKEKAKWEAEQKAKAAQAAAAPAAAPAAAAAAAPKTVESAKNSFQQAQAQIVASVIRNMSDLWERAYGCQAASIRVCHKITKLVEKIDAAKFEGYTDDTMNKIAAFSNEVKDEFDQLKAGEDVEKVRKASSFIRTKGGKTVKETTDRLYVAKKEWEREQEALRKKQADDDKKKREEERKAKQIEEDNQRIKEKFDALVSSGVFHQLSWKNAINQLQIMRDEFEFAESQVFADGIILKVKMMQSVQDVFIANCKDYEFAKSKLKKYKIAEISEREFKLIKPDGKTPFKLSWKKFYQEYHGNLNELIVKFIEKGRNKSKAGDGKSLNLQRWAETMMGAALTMQIICSDDPTSAARAEQIAKDAVKDYPEYVKVAQGVFPDISFDDIPVE